MIYTATFFYGDPLSGGEFHTCRLSRRKAEKLRKAMTERHGEPMVTDCGYSGETACWAYPNKNSVRIHVQDDTRARKILKEHTGRRWLP